jgi:hypothetical protein
MIKFMIKFKKELNKNDLYNLFVTIFLDKVNIYILKITNSK